MKGGGREAKGQGGKGAKGPPTHTHTRDRKQTRYQLPKVRSAHSNMSHFCMLFSSRILI